MVRADSCRWVSFWIVVDILLTNDLVRTVKDISTPHLTGVGYLLERDTLVVPRSSKANYSKLTNSERDTQLDELDFLWASPPFWSFPLHEACWQLLLDRLPGRPEHISDSTAACLFKILLSAPHNGDWILLPGHKYGGADWLQHREDNTILFAMNFEQDKFIADPTRYLPFSLHQYEAPAPRGKDMLRSSPIATRKVDPFSKLPVELRHLIFENLPSTDFKPVTASFPGGGVHISF